MTIHCEAMRWMIQHPPRGVEISRKNSDKTAIDKGSGAESGALGADGSYDVDLARLIAAWPQLPGAVRRRIVKLLDEAEVNEGE